MRKVDLQLPAQRRGERNKYEIFRLGSEEAGLEPEPLPRFRIQEQPEVTGGSHWYVLHSWGSGGILGLFLSEGEGPG